MVRINNFPKYMSVLWDRTMFTCCTSPNEKLVLILLHMPSLLKVRLWSAFCCIFSSFELQSLPMTLHAQMALYHSSFLLFTNQNKLTLQHAAFYSFLQSPSWPSRCLEMAGLFLSKENPTMGTVNSIFLFPLSGTEFLWLPYPPLVS